MFHLCDKTRRRIGFTLFFLFCLLPTVSVLAMGLWRQLPGHVRSEEDRLSLQTGQTVSLQRIHHLRPGTVIYEGVALADPQTERTVFRCRRLEAVWKRTADQQGRRKATLMLTASDPKIDVAGPDHLWRLIERLLTRRSERSDADVRLAAGEVVLTTGEASQTLTEVQGKFITLATATQAELSFRIAGYEVPEPVRVRVGRNRQIHPPITGLEFYTGENALPCSVLGTVLKGFGKLGAGSRFRGYLWANRTAEGWTGEATGQFADVDLDKLVTDRFPHQLGGTAQVTVERARFRRGRLESAAGSITAGPGLVSRSFLDALVYRLRLSAGSAPDASSELVRYDQLALSLFLDSDGLWLRGDCTSGGAGTILSSSYGPLLGEPTSQPQPVAAVLGALVPAREVQVPATRQTDWLLRRLPLPEAVAAETAITQLPGMGVRLGRRGEGN